MQKRGQVRIIGGKWKRRIIKFPESSELRPSPDSVRETLFNWLRNEIEKSTCLDLFAGSGAFGFESASRGASFVALVDNNSKVTSHLINTKSTLGEPGEIEIHMLDSLKYLNSTKEKFDIVFFDPPFDNFDIEPICLALIERKRLNPGAIIYIESPNTILHLPIPPTWHIIRESKTGMVRSTLIQS